MKHLLTYSYFKLFFTVVFTFVFNQKLQANTLPVSSNLNPISFSTNNLDENEDVEFLDVVILGEFENEEEEEEVFSNNFSSTFSNNIFLFHNNIDFYKSFNGHLLTSVKRRFYILYCQLKTHF